MCVLQPTWEDLMGTLCGTESEQVGTSVTVTPRATVNQFLCFQPVNQFISV